MMGWMMRCGWVMRQTNEVDDEYVNGELDDEVWMVR